MALTEVQQSALGNTLYERKKKYYSAAWTKFTQNLHYLL